MLITAIAILNSAAAYLSLVTRHMQSHITAIISSKVTDEYRPNAYEYLWLVPVHLHSRPPSVPE